MITTNLPVGERLREWRERRRMTQMELALEAEVSTRHVSFLETGRAQPSREMIQRLSEPLNIPLRERNALLMAAGFAPSWPERSLDDDALAAGRQAVELVLAGHEPYPALAVDRHWNLVAANRAAGPFFAAVDPVLATPPVNVLRATLHPNGLAPRIANLPQWREHMLARVRRQIAATADPVLAALRDELVAYPIDGYDNITVDDPSPYVVPFRLRTETGILSFLYTTTVFGSPLDVTLDELAIESFFPADTATAEAIRSTTS